MPITPRRLRCEYRVNPMGIDETRPRLSWAFATGERGQRQTAYRVLVARSEEMLAADRGDYWDSGRIVSDQSAHLAYAGAPLASRARCWWKVQAWDADGVPGPWSAPAWWEMGLLHADDWQADWISLDMPDPADGPTPSPFLRAVVPIARPVRSARLSATARGVYAFHLNGTRVGDAVLAPGWTDYDRRIDYQTYDVTDLLTEGENVLGAVLGAGWYCGHVGMPGQGGARRRYGAHPELLAQMHLTYADGTTEVIATDGTWRATTGPILSADLLMGETYDARRELTGWDAPGYDDGEWRPVAVTPRGATPALVAEPAQPIRVTEDLAAQSVRAVQPDVHVVDIGQNMVGWVRLRVRGEAGTRIQLRFAEMCNPDGTIYTENLRSAKQTDVYILKGAGEEVWEPHFTFHGFRYIEVTGYPGTIAPDALTGRVVHSDTPLAGTFACSDPMVNQLQRNIVWGQRGNFLSIPTDCPQRDERLGWLADAQVFARTATFNRDVAAFFTKWMADVADAQSAAGAFPDVAPRLCVLFDGAPAWGDAGVIVPWTIWQQYGDTRMIARYWDAMARWMDYLAEANPGYRRVARLGNNYGDWLALDTAGPSEMFVSGTPKDLLATAYWAYDARLMSQMARAIGREDEARRYDDLFARIKEAFVAAYVSEDGRVQGDTQTGYLLALHMDLLPDALRDRAATHLIAAIERKGWHLATGFVGVGLLCPTLAAIGRPDVAYRLLLNETFPSWGYSIHHGATTIWERWDGWTEEHGFQNPAMNSFNHYSLGSVGEWLYRGVAGIDTDPDAPGFRRVLIHPHPGGGLTEARAIYDSLHGEIAVEWTHAAGVFTLAVAIPANVTATVYIPTSDPDAVREADRPLAAAPGVTLARVEDGCAVLALSSGAYTFVSPLPEEDGARA